MTSVKDEIPFEQLAESDLLASRSPQVKSNAVVKYSAVSNPATYATLQSDTNINNPPSNWLKSYSDAYGLNHALPRNAGFTSFQMANMFVDCVGGVDVVSGSENVKNLLKIPYSNGTVSMMVHRIENTLLIDEFDIHKHLRSGVANDWSWLRKFYYDVISKVAEDKTALSPLDRTRNSLLEQSLVSKFLHYSLAESEEDLHKNNAPLNSAPLPIDSGPDLPEPLLEEGLPDSKNYKYTRNVVWSFEDIRMLLGTDMPIFGGPTRPCISLRLRDASKPINVLTGIDYWLDNLMSNVPEVVMCYHLDGIVQKYELIKTEDLPYLPESKFSPKLIRDVAQNILSFLKSNATKAGHTYWLFKGKNDDAVKLYDLTSLCSDTLEDKGQNPFTVPVGMLLYRVARNMKANGDESQLATIRVLLKNCLTLLDKEKHPQIVTSAHFILSDVYVPCDTDPCSPQLHILPDSDKNSNKEEVEDDSETGLISVPINDLCISKFSNTNNYSPPPITSGLEERSNLALQHVKEGLDCLQYFDKCEQENAAKSKENEPKMAKPHEPIPMPYSKLVTQEKPAKKKRPDDDSKLEETNKDDNSLKALLCRKTNETMPTWQKPDKAGIDSWKVHLGLLLTKKACLVYSILVERELKTEKYWLALKHIAGVLRCCEENKDLVGLMLVKAADCLLSIVSLEQIGMTGDPYPVVERPEGSLYDEEIELFSNAGDKENHLIASVKCYQRSLNLHHSIDTMRKIGFTCNVLNTYYTGCAANYITAGGDNEQINYVLKEAEKYLKMGLHNFDQVGDKLNWALLMSNLGRVNFLKAQALSLGEQTPIKFSKQKQFFKKAIEIYAEGLKHLESRKLDANIWDVLNWEMSCTLFSYETRLQERAPPPGSRDRADFEREMGNVLHQAIESCDLKNTDSKNYSIYQYRASILHHKLAALHRSSMQASIDPSKKLQLLRLINNHYSKAYSFLLQLENTSSSHDLLKVQIERIEFEESLAESAKKKKKHYFEGLNLAIQCKPALQLIENEKNSDKAEGQDQNEIENEKMLLKKLLEKLQFLLKSLVKILSLEKQADTNALKKVYASSLKKSDSETEISHLIKLLDLASNFKTDQNFN